MSIFLTQSALECGPVIVRSHFGITSRRLLRRAQVTPRHQLGQRVMRLGLRRIVGHKLATPNHGWLNRIKAVALAPAGEDTLILMHARTEGSAAAPHFTRLLADLMNFLKIVTLNSITYVSYVIFHDSSGGDISDFAFRR